MNVFIQFYRLSEIKGHKAEGRDNTFSISLTDNVAEI